MPGTLLSLDLAAVECHGDGRVGEVLDCEEVISYIASGEEALLDVSNQGGGGEARRLMMVVHARDSREY